jgi:carboxymethylenebutenolidase
MLAVRALPLPVLAALAFASAAQAQVLPERVTFPSNDGKTTLVGYLYLPPGQRTARAPAVVMMHGRAGAYSSKANGVYDASTLSQRHQAWAELWAAHGYAALLIDSFGPRGYAQGFPRYSYDSRPEALNEVTVRPLDAYGALAFLRTRDDVDGARAGLQGWSNGGSATLAAMAAAPNNNGFKAALVFYPGCGLHGRFDGGYKPYAPTRVFMGTADEEVSPKRCKALVDASKSTGGDITMRLYPGATHSFDDPGKKRQTIEANAEATDDAVARAVKFLATQFGAPTRTQ